MSNRLIKRYGNYATDSFSDYLMLIAANIEEGWMGTGAIPGEDYSRLDILKLATEEACRQFHESEHLSITCNYLKHEIDD